MAGPFDAGTISAKLSLNLNDWSASIETARKDSDTLAGSILKNQNTIRELGRTMTIVGGAIVTGFTMAVHASIKFNESMAQIATLIPKSTSRVLELKDSVEKMAIATGKGTTDLARGLYEVVSAFGDSADSAKILEINAKAATAGASTTLDAIKLTSAVTKGYGDTSKEAMQKVSDLAFLTVKLGQTTFPELSVAMGAAVPVAKTLNVKVEELFASMATLTGVTGNANEVTTQIQATMRGFMKQSGGMVEALEKLKVASVEEFIATEGLVGALRKVIATTDGSLDSIGKLFIRTEAVGAVLALTGTQAGVFDEKLKAMKNSAGATEEAFNEMTNGINKSGFQMTVAKEKMSAAIIKLGDAVLPIFTSIATTVGNIISKFLELQEAHPGLFKAVATLTLAVGGLLAVAGPLLLMLPTFARSFTLLSPLIGGAATKVAGLIGKMSNFKAGAIGIGVVVGTVIVVAINKWIAAMDAAIGKIYEVTETERRNTLLIRNAYKQLTPEIVKEIKAKTKAMHESGMASEDIAKKIVESYGLEKIAGSKSVVDFKKIVADKIKVVKELSQAVIDANAEAFDAIQMATLSDYNYSVWTINQKYNKQKEMLDAEGADKASFALNERARQAELTMAYKVQLDKRDSDSQSAADKIIKRAQDSLKKLLTFSGQGVKGEILNDKTKTVSAAEMSKNITSMWGQAIINMGVIGTAGTKKVKATFQETMQSIGKYVQVLQQGFSQFFQGLNQLSDNRYRREFASMDEEYEKKKKFIEDSLMTETEKNAAMELLDTEYATKKRTLEIKQAQATKKSGISQAIVNTALAIVSALSTKPFIPMGLIAAAMAAAAGAIQIAVIKSAPLPAMGEGGLINRPTNVLAGEAGPEAILPMRELQRMLRVSPRGGMGGSRSVIFNINAVDARGFDRLFIEQMVPRINRELGSGALKVPIGAMR